MRFSPHLTPREMLLKGVFGGNYFAQTILSKEVFSSWFGDLESSLQRSSTYKREINHFNIRAGQNLQEWAANGWIHPDDPNGWFEWYCKYHAGRRHEDDSRQIKRWNAFCGPNGRWKNIIYAKIHSYGKSFAYSREVSPRIQQSLLHWSYLVNEKDYLNWCESRAIGH